MSPVRERQAKLLAHFEQLVQMLYALGDGRDASEEWYRHQARVRGFQEAARVLELITVEEVQVIIDTAHAAAFGESRRARRERLDGTEAKVERGEWDSFESPAYERYRSKS